MKMEKQKHYEVWKRQLEEKEKHIEQMKAIKHDMQAHLLVLQYYLESGMNEEAKVYLKSIRDTQMMIKMEREVDTGNSLINALIEDSISRDEEICFLCEGRFPENIKLSDYELCILFSNLISNAVEACGRVSKSPKEISLKLFVVDNQFQIELENCIEWEIDVQALEKGTTKEDADNHGYGIKNLKKVVEHNNGNIAFKIEKNKFCVCVNIPIIDY